MNLLYSEGRNYHHHMTLIQMIVHNFLLLVLKGKIDIKLECRTFQHQLHCVVCKEMGKECDFDCVLTLDDCRLSKRQYKSITKLVTLVHCLSVAAINIYRDWIPSIKPGLNVRLVFFTGYWMLNLKGELPKFSSPTDEEQYIQMWGNLIREQLSTSLNALFATHYNVQALEVNDLFESLSCLFWIKAYSSSTRIDQ